jgi:hypothetical protein
LKLPAVENWHGIYLLPFWNGRVVTIDSRYPANSEGSENGRVVTIDSNIPKVISLAFNGRVIPLKSFYNQLIF